MNINLIVNLLLCKIELLYYDRELMLRELNVANFWWEWMNNESHESTYSQRLQMTIEIRNLIFKGR